jgi:hypothetical protein
MKIIQGGKKSDEVLKLFQVPYELFHEDNLDFRVGLVVGRIWGKLVDALDVSGYDRTKMLTVAHLAPKEAGPYLQRLADWAGVTLTPYENPGNGSAFVTFTFTAKRADLTVVNNEE